MIFALAGNQNCGKTTLFNALTGSNQHVGNFPGVTVDQKMGSIKGAKNCSVVDLPGIYSIRPYTQEEIVSRDFILDGKPDGIINIVDATNIERNLYLTLQLLELNLPMVLALNMMDEVRANGGTVNVKKLSESLGIPVIPISAAKNEGVSELADKMVYVAKNRILPKRIDFCSDGPVHRCIHSVAHVIEDHARNISVPPRFCSTKLIEGDEYFADKLELDKSTDLLNDNKDDKNGRLDLRAVINGNTECDIEVQLASNDNIAERFVYYWAKMYAANLKIGDTYSDLRKTISIIILDDDFKLTKNLEKPQTTWKIRENEELHLILTDYFEIIIIELPKVVKAYHKTPNDEVLQWMLFLDNPEKEEVSRIMEENKDIKEAKEELDRISQDDLLRRRVLNRTLEIADQLQMKKELEEARKELEEAKKEAQQAENEKENIIKNLHKLNIPIEQISKAVNLSEKEIKEILSTHS